jgi:hypothetical protein
LKKSPSAECQRRENPHENEYWQHFQQQGNGAGVPCVASPQRPCVFRKLRQKTFLNVKIDVFVTKVSKILGIFSREYA